MGGGVRCGKGHPGRSARGAGDGEWADESRRQHWALGTPAPLSTEPNGCVLSLETALAGGSCFWPHFEVGKPSGTQKGQDRAFVSRSQCEEVSEPGVAQGGVAAAPAPSAPGGAAASQPHGSPGGFCKPAPAFAPCGPWRRAGWGRSPGAPPAWEGRPPDLLANAVVLPLHGLGQRLQQVLVAREGKVHLHAGVGAHPAGLSMESRDQ